jgi:purine-binding chemotaxis protein CheW
MTGPTAPDGGHPGAEAEAAGIGYGGFRIGGMHLALPLSSLREVVPCKDLVPLPCDVACVSGGQQIRSTVVPVVDLRVVLDRPVTAIEDPCVIVMIHDGHVLGLLAERIEEVFCMAPARPGRVAAGAGSLFDICIPWGDTHPISVLSPAALMALARVPAILDPEPWRSTRARNSEPTHLRPHLLMQTGRWHLAIDALEVHSTLAASTVTAGALTHGACLGTIQVGQDTLAAFDLMALCGLGSLASGGRSPGFVIDCEGARVAFLVDTIVDFANADPRALVALAPYAMPRPGLMRGLLPGGNVAGTQHWFTLDGAALRACEEVASMAAATRGQGDGTSSGSGIRQTSAGRALLTFELDRKAAVPLEQIKEILGCTAGMAALGDGPVMGIAVSGGRSIAVLNLSRLVGWAEKPAQEGASILVVESGTDLVGFMVQRLCDIETSSWEPSMPTHEDPHSRQPLATLGGAGQQHLVAVIDLQDLASRVQAHERWPARRGSNPRPTA